MLEDNVGSAARLKAELAEPLAYSGYGTRYSYSNIFSKAAALRGKDEQEMQHSYIVLLLHTTVAHMDFHDPLTHPSHQIQSVICWQCDNKSSFITCSLGVFRLRSKHRSQARAFEMTRAHQVHLAISKDLESLTSNSRSSYISLPRSKKNERKVDH
ncbi:hypothetical protein BD289DRAFT_441292 [Coniella lustricola]|uniref:Uncharacterized protein n=1 Tax=Coniella lustricola TaxID=2025994 RepID=A0A2T2ZZN0_9PEZI|nr:hypothetical protein BD289DRAFT_441292 [Coniella lustricola]